MGVEDGQKVNVIGLSSPGLCGFMLWGLTSITIVPFIWLIYSIVLAVIGPNNNVSGAKRCIKSIIDAPSNLVYLFYTLFDCLVAVYFLAVIR